VKALFAQCGGLVPPPLNNMEVPTHIFKWVNKGCGHGNVESFNGRRICFNVSNGRGLKFHPPYK